MRALFDVNVLIALLDEEHASHDVALQWLGDHIADGWSSCAITQNGCLRIMSSQGYPNALPIQVVAERLREATLASPHEFWMHDVSLLDARAVELSRVHSARQLTDVYLLALAVHHGGRFVTFDRHVIRSAVAGATNAHLVVL